MDNVALYSLSMQCLRMADHCVEIPGTKHTSVQPHHDNKY